MSLSPCIFSFNKLITVSRDILIVQAEPLGYLSNQSPMAQILSAFWKHFWLATAKRRNGVTGVFTRNFQVYSWHFSVNTDMYQQLVYVINVKHSSVLRIYEFVLGVMSLVSVFMNDEILYAWAQCRSSDNSFSF